MKEKKIFDALTEVSEELIDEARNTKLKKKPVAWKKWTTIAASVLLIFGLSIIMIQNKFPIGGNTGMGSTGHTEGSIFMSYAGPVFPLSLSEQDNEIVASRNISYDFPLEYKDSLRVSGSKVKDSYINHGKLYTISMIIYIIHTF